MSTKVYKAHDLLSVPIVVDGKIVGYAEFKDENNTYRTDDKVYQSSLENIPVFGTLFKLVEEVKEEDKQDVKLVDHPEISGWSDAKDFLRETFGIPHQSLNTPINILKKAAESGICFPNLKIEE